MMKKIIAISTLLFLSGCDLNFDKSNTSEDEHQALTTTEIKTLVDKRIQEAINDYDAKIKNENEKKSALLLKHKEISDTIKNVSQAGGNDELISSIKKSSEKISESLLNQYNKIKNIDNQELSSTKDKFISLFNDKYSVLKEHGSIILEATKDDIRKKIQEITDKQKAKENAETLKTKDPSSLYFKQTTLD